MFHFEIVNLESVKVSSRKRYETGLITDGHGKLFRRKPYQSRLSSIVIWLLFFIAQKNPFVTNVSYKSGIFFYICSI